MRKYSYNRSKFATKLRKFLKWILLFEFKYKGLVLIILSLVIAYLILTSRYIHDLIRSMESFGYVGSFFVGMFYTYGLTSPIAASVFWVMGKSMNYIVTAFIASFGSLLSDFLIFRYIRDFLMDTIEKFFEKMGINLYKIIAKSTRIRRIMPIIGGAIIASPFPDELGIAFFSMVNYDQKKFALYTYLLNFIGILTITYFGSMS